MIPCQLNVFPLRDFGRQSCLFHAVYFHTSENPTAPAAVPNMPTQKSPIKPVSLLQCKVSGAYAKFDTRSFIHTLSSSFLSTSSKFSFPSTALLFFKYPNLRNSNPTCAAQ